MQIVVKTVTDDSGECVKQDGEDDSCGEWLEQVGEWIRNAMAQMQVEKSKLTIAVGARVNLVCARFSD